MHKLKNRKLLSIFMAGIISYLCISIDNIYADENSNKVEIDNTVEELLNNINGEVKKHVLITFTDKNLELVSISALVVTHSLQILYKEDWSEYIEPKYSLDLDNVIIDNDDEEIKLGLKVTKESIDNMRIKRNREKRKRN